MDAQQKKKLVRDFFAALIDGSDEAVLACLTEAPTWSLYEQTFAGREGVLMLKHGGAALFQPGSRQLRFDAQYVDGDTVISQGTLTATLPNGQTYTNYLATFVHLQGDRIQRVDEYVDTAAVNKMLGM